MPNSFKKIQQLLKEPVNLHRYGDLQRGSGSGMVIGVMVGLALVWGLVYGISNWIKSSTSAREKRNHEVLVEKKGKHGKFIVTPTYAPKEAGSYSVKCTGIFKPVCREVRNIKQ